MDIQKIQKAGTKNIQRWKDLVADDIAIAVYERLQEKESQPVFKFVEYKESEINETLKAFGIIAYIIGIDKGTATSVIFEDYFILCREGYFRKHVTDVDAWRRDLEYEFYTTHIIHEKRLINESNEIYEYLTPNDVSLLKSYAAEYLKYVELEIGKYQAENIKTTSNNDSTSPNSNILPEELNTQQAKEYFSKAIKAGFMDDRFQWVEGTTKYQIALFAEICSEKLNIKHKWKPFETLWNVTHLAQTRRESKERFGKVDREKEIIKIFE